MYVVLDFDGGVDAHYGTTAGWAQGSMGTSFVGEGVGRVHTEVSSTPWALTAVLPH